MTYFLLGAILGILTGAITVALSDETYDKKYKKGHCGLWLAKDSITKEFVCSECKGLIQLNQYAYKCYYNYCPNCGAKMDGGERKWAGQKMTRYVMKPKAKNEKGKSY